MSFTALSVIVFWSTCLQCLYWVRVLRIEMVKHRSNIFVLHLGSFTRRISFFFGGVLFSAVFFRQLPELDVLPPLGQTIAKGIYVVAILFGLFCYPLELDRLAKSFDGQSER